ncbi:receptor-type tyrosine-protein phosphatase S-like isoform X2 [Haliotis asinina]|uniref:receptor-type tyrosine-protein phosphatase S-like isoform X2 n=1 Tax=Haliotis asinina TaxID=109174 RepID=UPI00353276EC
MEMYLGTAVLFVIFLGHCSYSCLTGKYGYNCGYTCNCDHTKCDPSTGCSPPNCFPGWSGSTCHKHNVARGKRTSSSGDQDFSSSQATNGNTAANSYDVCIDTKPSDPNWWRVDLNDTVLIRDVTIYFRTDFTPRRNGIRVYLTNTTDTTPPSGHLCYNVTGRGNGTDINDILSVPCHCRGRYVLLYTTTANEGDTQPKLDFCEVEVDVCDPGTFGADCENYCHCKHGVCNYITGICPPGGCLAGWKGTSCDVRCVDSVEYGPGCVKNCSFRMCKEAGSHCPRDIGQCDEGCQPGWKGVDCTSECSSTYGHGCNKNCSSRHCGTSSSLCNHVTGACDHGCSAGWKDVDCVTECFDGKEYGAGCVKNCSSRKCKEEGRSCPRDTGRCDGGCQPGWEGEDCTSECTPNVNYGPGCHGNCSARKCKEVSGTCPRDTGRCDGGCQPGWEGVDCTSECTLNVNYGPGCHGNCSARKCKEVSGTCPHDTGRCDGGCQPGWEGMDCTSECTLNVSYGPGCRGNCSARKCKDVSGTCPRDTGRCDGGCQPGWEGVDCMLECQSRTFGGNCSSTCGHCVEDEPCHHVTGTCLKGCSPGWVNDTCQQAQGQSSSQSSGNGPVVGGAVGGVVVAVVAVVTVLAVFFYRRKRNANKTRTDNSVYEDVSAFEPQEPELHVGPSANAGYEEEEEETGRDADGSGENTASTYYNIGPAISTEVDVDKLGDRIRDMQATKQGFEKEYQKLISGFTHTYEASQLEGNTGKNRFLQYYPYDYNRVVLDKLPEDPFSDYINASYINGFSREQAYIAAQAPNKKTVTDFWRMIYQKNLTRIVILTNLTEMGKVKCEPYWSDTRDLEAGPFSISVTKVIQRACWVIRELTATVKQTGEHRIFYQFHFTKWPDHGTPDETNLMEFLWRVRKTPSPDTSPLLVHCSAGIGRTGTYIALDYLLDRALSDHKVDVFRFACDMRRQRRNMIQTKEQYACVYTTLYEVLTVGDTFLTSLDFVKQRGRKTVFKMGNLTVPRLIQRVKSDIQRAKTGKDMKGRVWVDGRADILAVMMPSHLSMNGYLLTEAPSVTTASLFWKLTEEQESSIVIVLPDSHQSVSCFLPAPGESLDLGPASITCSTENAINPDIVFRNIQRQIQGDASSQTVRVYMMMIFPTDDHSVLLDLLEQVDLGRRDNTPNPVTVVFGEKEKRVATLFCILSNIVLGIRYDNEVEIYNNIRRLGHLHANDLTQEEISVCYNLASTYLETQSVYANM